MRNCSNKSRVLSLCALLAISGTSGRAQQASQPQGAKAQTGSVRSFKVQGSVYMLAGVGANVTMQVGDDGVLVVDTQSSQMADALLAEIRRIAGAKPIRYVINTAVDRDHIGGNERFRQAGQAIVAGNVLGDVRDSGATLIAHENALNRMLKPAAGLAPVPPAAQPSETFFGDADELFFNDEAIQLVHVPVAHADGDVMVFFRKSDVISTGEFS